MGLRHWLGTTFVALLAAHAAVAAPAGGNMPRYKVKPYARAEPLQDIVTWDQHSIFVRGERVLFYSGEYHPFRLPVPGLWLDVLQKIRALSYTGISIYIDWAVLEGKPGVLTAEGVFALQPFFEAATQAGIYIIARPGPYINAEVSGGGFPGWLQRVPGHPRTLDPGYINATENYAKWVAEEVAKAQITNGGPVILFQPENEYYDCGAATSHPCPDPDYMQKVEDQARNAGVVVPFIVNDNNRGNFAPGTPAGVDIYGIDSYPLGFDCANPETWPAGRLSTTLTSTHQKWSPLTPFSFVEFQGGSFDPWGGWGFEQCLELVNAAFERVFYKNNLASAINIFSIYMTYGGTNWGNLGHPGGYTSYDYAAVIAEDRRVHREKYSEAKLIATFVESSPAYLTATPGNLTNGTTYTTSSAISVTPLWGNGSATNFYVVRHSDYASQANTEYKLTVSTSQGSTSIPQLGGSLSLQGRDSKIHVTDYKLGDINLLYSSAEIFTWKSYADSTVLVVYGNPGETHELAVAGTSKATVVEGDGLTSKQLNSSTVLNWTTGTSRIVTQFDNGLTLYILDRQSAFNYWVLKVPNDNGLFAPSSSASTVILKAGYLMRNVTVSGSTLNLVGDFNATTDIEVIGGAPKSLATLNINGASTEFKQADTGVVTTTVAFNVPDFKIPSLADLDWKYIDTLPEIQADYDDSAWVAADLAKTYNDLPTQTTPTSLFGSDYGFHTGYLLFRGRFTAKGDETTLFLQTQGGSAFASSVWLDGTYLGSFAGYDAATNGNSTYTLSGLGLAAGHEAVLTVLVDQMGMDENYAVGDDEMKHPRGILRYTLAGHDDADVTWKITGNLGGEDYLDKVRGPLNEGGLWAERQGYHLPGAPLGEWQASKGPVADGVGKPGVGWFAAEFDLDLPSGWDIPLSFTFSNASAAASEYRVQLYVNGWQFGKYVSYIGPQDSFPVPQGIWDYKGTNYIAFSLWSLAEGGAKVEGLELSVNATILSGYGDVPLSPTSTWSQRTGAY